MTEPSSAYSATQNKQNSSIQGQFANQNIAVLFMALATLVMQSKTLGRIGFLKEEIIHE